MEQLISHIKTLDLLQRNRGGKVGVFIRKQMPEGVVKAA